MFKVLILINLKLYISLYSTFLLVFRLIIYSLISVHFRNTTITFFEKILAKSKYLAKILSFFD